MSVALLRINADRELVLALWERPRAVPRPEGLPRLMATEVDRRRVSRQGVRRGTPRFALTLPLALNHAWSEIWRARARIRVLVEVVLGGE